MYFTARALFLCYLFLSTHAALPKHIVVLMMENRSFDHMLGWLKRLNPDIDGLTGKESNPYDTKDPNGKKIVVNDKGYDIATFDPGHGIRDTAEEIYGIKHFNLKTKGVPKMNGFIQNALEHCGTKSPDNSMSMFTINGTGKVLNTLAMNFAVFDKWFCSIPGPTDPNRGFFMSGTSNGMTDNFNGTLWSQQSYFDWLNAKKISWRAYYQKDPWAIMYFQDMHLPHNKKNVFELDDFFTHVKNGELAQFTVLQPQMILHGKQLPNWQHPDAPVSEGEKLYKKIYENLRNSSFWSELAFLITYDEHGGFYDHVTPPQDGIPNPDGVISKDGFKFDRLGVRIPMVAISPLIPAGTVVHEPPNSQKPTTTSQYDATSIIATTNKIFGISDHMHARDKWAGTFEHIFSLDKPRDDCPINLPEIPETPTHYFTRQENLPLNDHLKIQVQFFCKFNGHFSTKKNCGKEIVNQKQASEFIAREAEIFMKRTDSTNFIVGDEGSNSDEF